MDLLSLPDEMVASVLKYSDYPTISRIRKMNRRSNKIAKVYDIGRLFPVTSLCLTSCAFNDLTSLPWKYTIELDKNAVDCHPNMVSNMIDSTRLFDENSGSHLDIIEELLKKIDIHGTLKIASFCHPIDDQLLAVFFRNRKSFRNMDRFILSITNVACSESSVMRFIGSAKKLRDYQIGYSDTSMEVFFQTEMLQNRQWDYLSICDGRLYSIFKYPSLNDEFLLKVVKNCKNCLIDFMVEPCTSITVEGVIKLIEVLIREEITPEHIFIESAFIDEYNFYEMEERIQNISPGMICNFDSYCYLTEDGTNLLITKNHSRICFPSNSEDEVIQFSMCHITEIEPVVEGELMDQ